MSAIFKTWKKCALDLTKTPAKSSLSEFRERVSYKFFEDIFEKDKSDFHLQRKKYNGFYIYAVDGDQYDLPASENIIDHGFRGHPLKNNKETHYPKMHVTQAYDVINGTIAKFDYSTEQDEIHLAREMASGFEENSITIYDRLHSSYYTIFAHTEANNFYIIRARAEGPIIQKNIQAFRDSSKRSEVFLFKAYNELTTRPPLAVRLVKIKNPKSGQDLIFMTNLLKEQFSDQQIAKVYQKRWEIEGAFRDQTCTLKNQQWHSKSLNGILQEIYTSLWLFNVAKRECMNVVKAKPEDWLDDQYAKSNLKLCISIMMENIGLLIAKHTRLFLDELRYFLKKSTENRKHLTRNYPRVVKSRGAAHPTANVVQRRV